MTPGPAVQGALCDSSAAPLTLNVGLIETRPLMNVKMTGDRILARNRLSIASTNGLKIAMPTRLLGKTEDLLVTRVGKLH